MTWRLRLAAGVLGLSLAACQTLPPSPGLVPGELATVPFHPQEAYQCGPAALATVLGASGVAIAPDALVPEIYLPARKGALLPELVAASRRHGRVAYRLDPELAAVRAALADGLPVLVLQNLGLSWLPRWHFAVVVGEDRERQELILRSGRQARQRLPVSVFDRTWARGDRAALVVVAPDNLRPWMTSERVLRELAQLERLGQAAGAATGYRQLLRREPAPALAALGLGNALQSVGDAGGAEQAYRRAMSLTPELAAAWHNLADLLLSQGRLVEALPLAERAVALQPSPTFIATRDRIRQAQQQP